MTPPSRCFGYQALQSAHVRVEARHGGVDTRNVQALGGWRTLAMVKRYSHLAPDHLRPAVERLVPASAGVDSTRIQPAMLAERVGVS